MTDGPALFGPMLYGDDERVARFVASRIVHMRGRMFENYSAIGVVRGGSIVGGIVYHDHTGHDIRASGAFDTLRWWHADIVRQFFVHPFVQFGCVRITMMTGRKNKPARKMIERLGFKLEGVHPHGLDGREDAISYGMLRKNCVWLKE